MDIRQIYDFEEDTKNAIKKRICAIVKSEQEIERMGFNNDFFQQNLKEISLGYYNFLDNVIIPCEREVIITETLKNNTNYYKYKDIILDIKKDFEEGQSIYERQTNQFRKKYNFKDKIHNYINVHHLHIQKNPTDRGGEYLLVYIPQATSKKVYFLDISNHDLFSNDETKKITERFKIPNLLIENNIIEQFNISDIYQQKIGLNNISPTTADEFNKYLESPMSIIFIDKNSNNYILNRPITVYSKNSDGKVIGGGIYFETGMLLKSLLITIENYKNMTIEELFKNIDTNKVNQIKLMYRKLMFKDYHLMETECVQISYNEKEFQNLITLCNSSEEDMILEYKKLVKDEDKFMEDLEEALSIKKLLNLK